MTALAYRWTTRPTESEFRQYVRDFLEGIAPRREGFDESTSELDLDVDRARAFQRALFDAGLAGLRWPKEYGGAELGQRYQTIYNEEAAQFYVPIRPFRISMGTSMPLILTCGTHEQKLRYVIPTLRGDTIFCQLFSEPSSGSDLASVRSSVVRDGDEWVLNGQKVWTSGAHFAQFGVLLARSDSSLPKHKGLSMFVLDMSSPGITVSPLKQITGEANFNQVFFDDVRIPADAIIGEPGEGWRNAITVLMNERVPMANMSAEKTDRLAPVATHLQIARENGKIADPVIRQEIMDMVVRFWAADLLGIRQRQQLRPGQVPGPDGSLNKLGGAINLKRSAVVELHVAGMRGTAWAADDEFGRRAAHALLDAPARSIAGGTTQVVRNIIGERVLGLAKEPGVDPNTPFRDLPAGI